MSIRNRPVPLFGKEGLGYNAAYLRSVTVLFSTR